MFWKREEKVVNVADKETLDYLIGIAQKLNSLSKDIAELQKGIDMLRDAASDHDITGGINDIMSFNGRSKHDA
jgi:hypothetical protein